MSNSIIPLDYANTFSDWLVVTNQLITIQNNFSNVEIDLNSLQVSNTISSNGTIFANSSNTSLFVSNNATISGNLKVGNTIFSNTINTNSIISQTANVDSLNTNFSISTLSNVSTLNVNTLLSTYTNNSGNVDIGGILNVTGEIRSSNKITAYFSDDRLKINLGNIPNALSKVCSLNGFYYEPSNIALDLGYPYVRDVGVSAQEVQKILPEIVTSAPVDKNYLTIYYDRLIPLLVESIKELKSEIDNLKNKDS